MVAETFQDCLHNSTQANWVRQGGMIEMTDYSSSLSILPPLYLVISNLSFKPNSNPSAFVQIILFGSPLLIPNLFGYIIGSYS